LIAPNSISTHSFKINKDSMCKFECGDTALQCGNTVEPRFNTVVPHCNTISSALKHGLPRYNTVFQHYNMAFPH
jgi:hypothetical protein